jgi:hypothetical protein
MASAPITRLLRIGWHTIGPIVARVLRYFALDGTDHPDHATQGRMIRRYIAWRNRHADDRQLRRVIERANVA